MDKNFDIINAALAGFREEYRARYVAAYTSRLDQLKAKLAARSAVNWPGRNTMANYGSARPLWCD